MGSSTAASSRALSVAESCCGTDAASAACPAAPRGADGASSSSLTARANALDAGVADRVTFQARDAADPSLCGQYDLAVIVEALHYMSRPVDVLASVRRLLAPGGTLIVADERVADFPRAGGRDRAPLLRLQRPGLPANGDGLEAVGRDRHRHATIDPGALCRESGVLGGVGPTHRARLPALLPARPIAGMSSHLTLARDLTTYDYLWLLLRPSSSDAAGVRHPLRAGGRPRRARAWKTARARFSTFYQNPDSMTCGVRPNPLWHRCSGTRTK